MLKVFESTKDGNPRFMFYGVNGSKKTPLNNKLVCERKIVRDGSGKRWYLSGFHVYEWEDMMRFIKTLKVKRDNRFIVEVWASSPRKKHSRSKAYLCDKMIVTKKAWKNKIRLADIDWVEWAANLERDANP